MNMEPNLDNNVNNNIIPNESKKEDLYSGLINADSSSKINTVGKKEFETEQQIKNANTLGELYKVIKNAGGIQGSSEYYDAEQIWKCVHAYVENKADENTITRADGLRNKVKELKIQRDINKQLTESKNLNNNIEYFLGKKVNIRRSSGQVESDWNIGEEPRTVNNEKIYFVYKGEYQNPKLPLKPGTTHKEVTENELNELNN